MEASLNTVRVNNWKWHIKTPDILESWFDNYQEFEINNCIKRNNLRTIFTVEIEQTTYYVKHDMPHGIRNSLKTIFKNKSADEFRSAKLLEANQIPVVEYIGWGEKGKESMLITKEVAPNIATSKVVWHDLKEQKRRDIFIQHLVELITSLLNHNIVHPDFHLGNVLCNAKKLNHILVDVYGIKQVKKLSKKQKFNILHILGSFKGRLPKIKLFEIFSQFVEEPQCLWDEIMIFDAAYHKKNWEKRSKQILLGNLKYTQATPQWLIRRAPSGEPIFSAENRDNYPQLQATSSELKEIWLNSFFLEFNQIAHQRPIAWDKTNGVIYFENTAYEFYPGNVKQFERYIKDTQVASQFMSGYQFEEMTPSKSFFKRKGIDD